MCTLHLLCLYLNFDQIIIILQRTVSHRRRVIMKKFYCCSVAAASKILAVIGIISYSLSLVVFIYEIERIEKKNGVESLINMDKMISIGKAGCVFSGIGIYCCILPFCGLVMPLLIFIPVDFIKGVVFIIKVGYVRLQQTQIKINLFSVV